MKIIADLHTHSLMSGHAFSTIKEMAIEAKKKKLKILAITDHGPNIPGCPKEIYFHCAHIMPEYIEDVRILAGTEVNIINKNGGLDLNDNILKNQEIVLAGFHPFTDYDTNNITENTEAIINVLKNPYVDVIAHIGNPVYPVIIEEVIDAAKKYNKLFEVNNRSFVGGARSGSHDNCKKVIKLAIQKKIPLIINSDAHQHLQVGCVAEAIKIVKECGGTDKHILNTDYDKLNEYLNSIHTDKRAKENVS
jgi:putative hydrolase